MKTTFNLLFLLITMITYSQTGKITMSYDSGGNQIQRKYMALTRLSNPNPKNIEDITTADLLKTDIYDDIKYYPNPVREQLYVTWKNKDGNYVTGIELYNLNGQEMKKQVLSSNEDSYIVDFLNYPSGYYNLILVYKNQEKKNLKIVKQ